MRKKLLRSFAAIFMAGVVLVSQAFPVFAETDLPAAGEEDIAVNCESAVYSDIDVTVPEAPASDFNYEVNEDGYTIKITRYKGNSEYVRVPGSIAGLKVTVIGDRAFSSNYTIKKVILPEGVKQLEGYVFYMCKELADVYLPETLEKIGNDVFNRCVKLETIMIPDSVQEIGQYAFYLCEELYEVNIPYGVTVIERYTFYGCSSLPEIEIPGSVTEILFSAFNGCSSLKGIKIPGSVVKLDGYAFKNCISLDDVEIPAELVDMGSTVFSDSSSETMRIQSVYLGKGTNPGRMYVTDLYCEGSEAEEINYLRLVNAVNYHYNVSISEYRRITGTGDGPDNIPTPAAGTVTPTPYGTPAAGTVTPTPYGTPAAGTTAPTPYGTPAAGTTAPTATRSPGTVTNAADFAYGFCEDGSGIYIDNYRGTDTDITIPDTIDGYAVAEIGYIAFFKTNVKRVVIPEGVTKISNSAFSKCADLTEILIPGTVIKIGEFAFSDCTSLEKIELPESIDEIGKYAFCECSSLKSIEIPVKVTEVPYCAFWKCGNLQSVKIPEGVTKISNSAFSQCSSLIKAEIPESVRSIDNSAFSYCTKLEHIVIPSNVDVSTNAFFGCSSDTNRVKSLYIGKGTKFPSSSPQIFTEYLYCEGSEAEEAECIKGIDALNIQYNVDRSEYNGMAGDSLTDAVSGAEQVFTSGKKAVYVVGTTVSVNIPGVSKTDIDSKGKAGIYDKNTGKIKLNSKGTVKLFTMSGGKKRNLVTFKCVVPKLKNLKLKVNKPKTIKLKGLTCTGWRSSNAAVAAVSNGTVTPKAAGSADISVIINGVKFKFNVLVQ